MCVVSCSSRRYIVFVSPKGLGSSLHYMQKGLQCILHIQGSTIQSKEPFLYHFRKIVCTLNADMMIRMRFWSDDRQCQRHFAETDVYGYCVACYTVWFNDIHQGPYRSDMLLPSEIWRISWFSFRKVHLMTQTCSSHQFSIRNLSPTCCIIVIWTKFNNVL